MKLYGPLITQLLHKKKTQLQQQQQKQKKGRNTKVSPKELAGLVPELNVDAAAGAEVFPHDGDFGASGLRASAGGKARDRGGLQGEMQRKERWDGDRNKRETKRWMFSGVKTGVGGGQRLHGVS